MLVARLFPLAAGFFCAADYNRGTGGVPPSAVEGKCLMGKDEKLRVVFPGSFDPLTNGHLDIIRRGAALFAEVIVGVSSNPQKKPLLRAPQRVAIVRQAVVGMPNVRVETFRGLTVDFVRQLGAHAILRGIRNSSDLQAELQMAMTNRAVAGVETIFLLTSPRFAFTSSTLIKQITRMGGDASNLVPPEVLPYLGKKGGKASGRTVRGGRR
jgi:pantetheine-phosphate adenylyltransferase